MHPEGVCIWRTKANIRMSSSTALHLAFLRLGLFIDPEACCHRQSASHQAPGSLPQTPFAGSTGLCLHAQLSLGDLNAGSYPCALFTLHTEPSFPPGSSPAAASSAPHAATLNSCSSYLWYQLNCAGIIVSVFK